MPQTRTLALRSGPLALKGRNGTKADFTSAPACMRNRRADVHTVKAWPLHSQTQFQLTHEPLYADSASRSAETLIAVLRTHSLSK
jgi:hypothetical protein